MDIQGTSNNDVLNGTADDDVISGLGGNDTLRGGEGNDSLNGGDGNDTVNGEGGNDTLSPGLGQDNVDGGTGNDLLIVDYSANENPSGSKGIKYNSFGSNSGGFTGSFYAYKNNNASFDRVSFSNIERFDITGTQYGDDIRGGSGNDVLKSGEGNDTITSGGGNDIVDGGEGIDTLNDANLSGATEDLTIDNTSTTGVTVSTGAQIRGIERFVNLTTGSGDDTIAFSGIYDDSLNTGAGDDTINAGLGNDTVNGGDGNDLLIVDYSANENPSGSKGIRYNSFGSNSGGFTGRFYAYKNNNASFDQVSFSNIERFDITGTQYGDVIQGGSFADRLIGGAGNDTITAGGGNDIVQGVNEKSATPGLGEIDSLTGGDGADQFILGDRFAHFYDDGNAATSGTTDYARITDFNPTQDTIQLKGPKTDYRLDVSPIGGISGTALYLVKPGDEPDELVAIFERVTGLDLNSSAFVEAVDNRVFGVLSFGDVQFSVNEDGTPIAAVTVNRLEGRDGAVSATITLGNGTATAPQDYGNTPIVVSFADGDATSKIITFPIVDDSVFEGNETLSLTLTNPQGGAAIGSQNSATLTIVDNDLGVLAFSNASFSGDENGTVQVTLTRTGNLDIEVGATLQLNNGTATFPADYSQRNIAVTFAVGETSKTIDLPIVDDAQFEPNETINLTLINPTAGATLGTQRTSVFTIVDNDAPIPGTFAFSSSQFSVNEDGTSVLAVTIARTGGSDGAVDVVVTPTNGTATAPADYDGNPITVSFANGETTKTVNLPIVDDAFFEGNETLSLGLNLSDPGSGATLGSQTTATLTILDNDAPQQGSLAFSAPMFTVNEDGTAVAAVTVTRTGGSDGEVSADLLLTDGTARATNGDYIPTPITVTFANGDAAPKVVNIPVLNDSVVEATETLNLTLANVTGGATLGGQKAAVLSIVDNDVQLNFGSSSYTVREDGTVLANITVTRSGSSTGAVSATLAFTDGTAKGCTCAASSVNNDYHNAPFTITLAEGETSKVVPVELASLGGTNAIRIRDDAKAEGNEFFTISLTNPIGGATIGSQGSANVTILDNDVELAFSAPQFRIKENGEAVAAVTVTRTGNLTDTVGATLVLTGDTATFPDDFLATSIPVSFAPGETSQVITIPVKNDVVAEPDETIILALTNPTGGAAIGTQGTATLTIVDNGLNPALSVSFNKGIVAESAGSNAAIGTVTRNIVTDQDLVVTLTSSDTTEATVPTQITILANQASATFNLGAVNDGVADGIQPVTVTAAAAGFGNGSNIIAVSDINVPDLMVTELAASTPLLSGKQATFTYKVENQGLAPAIPTAPETKITDRVYLSKDTVIDGSDTLLAEPSITAQIPVGQGFERTITFFTPQETGQYYLIATTDAANTVNEGGGLGDSNNTKITPVTIAPAYRAVVSTNTEVGLAGSPVTLRGQAISNADGAPVAFEFVTVAVKNNGFVRELSAFTDANGNFVKAFNPLPNEGGTYEINAYFPSNPGEDALAEDSFKLLGMRFDTSGVSHKVFANQPFTAQANLQNLADINLNGLTYTVEGAPSDWDVQVNLPSTLPGSGLSAISYTIAAPNESLIVQDSFNIKLSTVEGVTATLPVNVNLERITPRLVASTNTLNGGMLRGEQTFTEFTVTNEGGATAEDIQVLLPDVPWMKLSSPATIDALAPGESAKVTLLLAPDAELPLTTYQGNLFLDSAGNDGDLSLPFNFRATSEAVGSLRINVANELTYFAEGSPKLAGATVILRDYFTNQEVRQVVTDQTGVVAWDGIAEGYYKLEVKADKHSSFEQTIQLDAGEVEQVNSFLSRETVQYTWTVTPTEIEDRYTINVESIFETDVPIPTIVIDPPLIDLADLQVAGQVMQIDLTLTNHGLIAANDVKLNFGESPFYKIELLANSIDSLSAKSSITIPVRITQIAESDTLSPSENGDFRVQTTSNDCKLPLGGLDYYYECAGVQIKRTIPIPFAKAGICSGLIRGFSPIGGGNGLGGGGAGGGGYTLPTISVQSDCDPCVEQNKQGLACIILSAVGCLPVVGCVTSFFSCAIGFGDGEGDWQDWTSCTTGLAGCIFPPACIPSLVLCIDDFCYGGLGSGNGGGSGGGSGPGNGGGSGGGSGPGNSGSFTGGGGSFSGGGASGTFSVASGAVSPIQQGIAKIAEFGDRLQTVIDAYLAIFGNDTWLKVDDETAFSAWFAGFSSLIQGSTAAEAKITAEERTQLLTVPVPAPLTGSDVNQFIDRWNRTVEYWDSGIFNSFDVQDGQSQDFLAIDNLKKANTALVNAIEQTEAEGYTDLIDGVTKTAQELQKAFEGNGGGVCATVKIRIDQDAIMTRSAFLGELEIDNGNLSSLENISVNLQVKDSQGNVVNDLFGITDPLLKNITAVDGTGTLTTDDPNTPQDEGVGSAQWTFIPTNLAAPEVPTQYSIGGTLSYTENGQVITVPLISTPVTVYPQAELYLDYFQERNVYGDDPFTDKIETSVPFSLGVLVRNEGKGEAKNLQITSGKPKIVENEKGLLIDFQIIGSEVNGQGATPSLTANFGNIGAGETAVADWLFKSSLQGKFIEYSADFKHLNTLGISELSEVNFDSTDKTLNNVTNPELSLIKSVNIHELTRKVRVDSPTDDGLPDFLVNDVFDANFYPDTLYFSNGGTAPVNVNTTATADGPATLNDLTVQVTATTEAGWSYLRLDDPAAGLFQIKSVLRADGTELLLDNVWRTDRTFPATGRPIYEDILHVLDFAATGGPQTYTVVYTTGDQTPPKVQDIVDVAPDPRTTAVNTIDVVFTEVIQSDTFDITDLTLTRNGGPNLITSGVTLTQIDTATYRIGNLAGLTGNAGEYQLSINASGVKDLEGLSGTGTVTEGWVFTGDGPAITAVTGLPSPLLKAPIDTLDVAFTEAIDPTSFDFNDILLNRDGGGNLVNNTVTITQLSGLTYRIGNLSGLTSVDGAYTLLVNASAIADTDGNLGTGSKGLTWALDTDAPLLTSITDVTSPRNTKVSSLDISFSQAIDPTTFDLSDLVLTRDGSTNLLTSSATLTQLTPTSYRLGGLTGLQATDGTYTLGVVGSGIQDTAANAVANALSETWTLDTVAPLAPINLQVNGKAASGANQFKTNATTVQVTGALGESGLKVFIRDKALNQILGQATVTGTSFESTVQLTGPGARELELQVVDAAGNTTTTPLSLFADVTAPAVVEFLGVPQDPTTTSLNTVDIRFSEELNPATFDLSDLTLTRDGSSNLITSATTLELISGTTYRLSGLADLTGTPGAYTLTVNTPNIQDLAGNAGLETKSASFTVQAPPTPGVIFAQSNGSTAVTEGGTTDTYTAVLKTQPTADVILTLAVGDRLTTDQTILRVMLISGVLREKKEGRILLDETR